MHFLSAAVQIFPEKIQSSPNQQEGQNVEFPYCYLLFDIRHPRLRKKYYQEKKKNTFL